MISRTTGLVTIFCLLLLSGGSYLHGQATSSLLGTVQDQTGAVIPGATVTITSQGTGVSRVLQTDEAGRFIAPLLPVGVYTIKVAFKGFQEAIQKDLTLQVDEDRRVDFTLVPAAMTQEVQVSGTAVAVETQNPTLGQVITSQQVADLPLNGRDFVQLATLLPGTTHTTDPNSFFNGGASSEVTIRGSISLSVGGSRENDTDWRLDGVDSNELTAGGISILPSIDAIQEFKVETFNYSAEYGVRGGPTVLLTIKSGTNSFHGTAFEFLRNTSLDARSFFAPSKEKFNQNQFGGSFGGPIQKDKTFFFIDYQEKRLRQGETFVAQVPTMLMRQGIFTESFPGAPAPTIYNPFSTRTDPSTGQLVRDPFPSNAIPAPMQDKIALQLLNFFPPPNVPGVLSGNYVSSPVKALNEREGDVRLDHNFSSKDTLFARFSYDQAGAYQPSGLPGFGAQAGGFASNQNLADHGRNAALSETHIFSPKSINKFTIGYNRVFDLITSFGTGSNESAKLGIPGSNVPNGVSEGLVDTTFTGGFWSVGDRGFAPFQGGTSIYHIEDSFDVIRGTHDIVFGGEWRANQLNSKTDAFQDGFYLFDNLFTAGFSNGALNPSTGSPIASILLSLPVVGIHDYIFQGTTTGRRWKIFRPYIQDDWRIKSNLTINLGLAYNLTTPTKEEHDRQTNFDFATGKFAVAGRNANSSAGIQTYTVAFEPRVGFAWSPRGSKDWAVRGGYGIFHSSGWNQGTQGLWLNPPFVTELDIFGDDINPSSTLTLEQGFPVQTQPTDPSQFIGNLNSQPPNAKLGIIQQYNFNVQRELPAGYLLTVGYAGSRSSHLMTTNFNLNTSPPNLIGFDAPQLRPYPQFGDVTCFCDRGQTRYESLQIKVETKSPKHGLYLLAGYTFSKGYDNGLADQLATPTGTPYFPLQVPHNSDKGFSEMQLNHNFTASFVYDLPFGKGKKFGSGMNSIVQGILGNWQMNGITRLTSGFPIYMFTASNNSGTNVAGAGGLPGLNRPDRICNGQLAGGQRNVNEWFDTTCFVDPAPGLLGNSVRAPLFGPNFINFDFSMFKTFSLPVREGAKLQFRSEFFNIFNHPQFALPGDFEGAPGFGQITSTVNNARLIQFALKIIF